MPNLHKFDIYKIKVDEDYVQNCANNYLKLLTNVAHVPTSIDNDALFLDLGFTSNKIKDLIKKYSLPARRIKSRKDDIYRSDLGELIMASFFEKNLSKKYPSETNFHIPIKNISSRENVDMSARGFDVFGYRLSDKIDILLGEAKVSEEKTSPPQVVDSSADSLYKNHTRYKTDKEYLSKRLMNIAKKMSFEHSRYVIQVVDYLDNDLTEKFKITHGCCLLRDTFCFKDSDFGKMKLNSNEFNPNTVHFILVCFNKSITEVVDKFHQKVLELNK